MVSHIQAQLQALRGTATAPAPAKRTPGPPAPAAAVVGLRNTPKEQPGPKVGTPVRWNVASGLFRQQHPGMFRVVVVGNDSDLSALLTALETLTPGL